MILIPANFIGINFDVYIFNFVNFFFATITLNKTTGCKMLSGGLLPENSLNFVCTFGFKTYDAICITDERIATQR